MIVNTISRYPYGKPVRHGAGDELAAGCAKSQMFHDAAQATM